MKIKILTQKLTKLEVENKDFKQQVDSLMTFTTNTHLLLALCS